MDNKKTIETVKQMVIDGQVSQNVAERYFPELKKSEDEKIRKSLIDYCIKGSCGIRSIDTTCNDFQRWIAWLEKQKPVVNSKFRVGDNVVSTNNPRLTYKILEVGNVNELGNQEYKVEIFKDGKAGIANKPHNIHNIECLKMDEWGELAEPKPVEWSEEDEKTISPELSKSKDDRIREALIAKIKEIADKEYLSHCGDFYAGDYNSEEIIAWLENQKHTEWSIENDERLNRIIDYLIHKGHNEDADWLKSLHPQNK